MDSKTSEANAMKEHVCLLEGQLHQSEQTIAGVKEQLWGLEEEVAQLQADQVALQLQLELDSANVRSAICHPFNLLMRDVIGFGF